MSDAIRLTKLPSGLTVVSEKMPRVETVSIGAYVNVGARHETEAENGVSHFLEHMAFKGTERRDAATIAREIENVGGQINAYTDRENTAYFCKVLKEDVGLASDILGDILSHSTFAADEVERERGVILQEIGRANDTPDDVVFDHFQNTAFGGQAMGRPILGNTETVGALSRDALAGYMRRHYGHRRMIVSAAGAIEHDDILNMVSNHFADLPLAEDGAAEAARYTGGEFREERDLDQVHLVLGFPSVPATDPEAVTTKVLSILLGGGMSSRLFHEIREKRGLVYSVYSFVSPFADTGLFTIYAGTGEDQVQELVPVALEELRRVQMDVTADELMRAKAQLRASLLMSLESTSSRCEQMARQLQIRGRIIPVEETKEKIAAVTVERVQAAAARMFRGKPTLATMGPISKVPSLAAIADGLAA